jgi:hypothetical protein
MRKINKLLSIGAMADGSCRRFKLALTAIRLASLAESDEVLDGGSIRQPEAGAGLQPA